MSRAADRKCLTLSEARATWPGVHLWWYRGNERQRCWSNVRGRNTARSVRPHRTPETEPTPLPPLPDLTQPVASILASRVNRGIIENPPAIIPPNAAEPIFSTFAGEPPDEWPAPDRPSLAQIWMLAATCAGLVVSVVALFRESVNRAAG